MVDTSGSGQRVGRQIEQRRAESTGASDTESTTDTNAQGTNPTLSMNFAAFNDRITELERLVHASPSHVPQSASNTNATAENRGNANSPYTEDRLTQLNQYIERFKAFNSTFEGLFEMFTRQLERLIDGNDGFGERLQRLETRSNAVEERLQAFDERLQRFAGSSHDVEQRLDMLDRLVTNFAIDRINAEGTLPLFGDRLQRLETRSMANQNDAVTRLANRLSRTNQRIDRLEERIPEDNEHWTRVLEMTREAANPTSTAPSGLDQLEHPPHGPLPHGIHPHGIHPHDIHPHDIHPHEIHPHGVHPHCVHPHGVHSHCFHPVGFHPLEMPPSGPSPNGAQRGIPPFENAPAANSHVIQNGHSTVREATNGVATNGDLMNGDLTNGEATNGEANRQIRTTIRTLPHHPILHDDFQRGHPHDDPDLDRAWLRLQQEMAQSTEAHGSPSLAQILYDAWYRRHYQVLPNGNTNQARSARRSQSPRERSPPI